MRFRLAITSDLGLQVKKTSTDGTTVCSKSLDPLYRVTYLIKYARTSWTYSNSDPGECMECVNYGQGGVGCKI